jgi:hypothetical protein
LLLEAQFQTPFLFRRRWRCFLSCFRLLVSFFIFDRKSLPSPNSSHNFFLKKLENPLPSQNSHNATHTYTNNITNLCTSNTNTTQPLILFALHALQSTEEIFSSSDFPYLQTISNKLISCTSSSSDRDNF